MKNQVKSKQKVKIKVMDATIPMILTINKQDVRKAKPGDMDNCVVAKAIQRHLGAHEVCVGRKIISVLKDGVMVRFMTPASIAKNLPIFDKTGCWSLPSGTYSLRPPSKSYRIATRIADTNKRRPASNYKGKKRTGKPIRYAATRALHSRTSSHFQSVVRKATKVVVNS